MDLMGSSVAPPDSGGSQRVDLVMPSAKEVIYILSGGCGGRIVNEDSLDVECMKIWMPRTM